MYCVVYMIHTLKRFRTADDSRFIYLYLLSYCDIQKNIVGICSTEAQMNFVKLFEAFLTV